jgi:hypothetical protein
VTTTQYSIAAAHRITGKSRTTIAKHLRAGKLSCVEDPSGAKLIDASELMRVYGDDCDFSGEETHSGSGGPALAEEGADASLRTQLHTVQHTLNTLLEERTRERQQLQSQIEHLQKSLQLAQEGHNRATLLLENRSGGGEWREAIQSLERRFEKDRDTAEENARKKLMDQPWWRLVWGRVPTLPDK